MSTEFKRVRELLRCVDDLIGEGRDHEQRTYLETAGTELSRIQTLYEEMEKQLNGVNRANLFCDE